MISHSPYRYERTSSDVDRESRGVFRVLHNKGLHLDCTYNRLELQGLRSRSERPQADFQYSVVIRGRDIHSTMIFHHC